MADAVISHTGSLVCRFYEYSLADFTLSFLAINRSISNATNSHICRDTQKAIIFTLDYIYKLTFRCPGMNESIGELGQLRKCENNNCIYLVRPGQPIIDPQGPGLSGLIHKEAHPVPPYPL